MVTVLLPTYNNGKFLKEAVQSVLDSSYRNFELLIINDGSTDNTEEIINTFSDKRIRLISQLNRGLIYSLNLGLKIARYDFIARIDGDDVMHPKRLEKQLSILLEGNVDIVGSNAILIDEKGGSRGKLKLPEFHNGIAINLKHIRPSILHPAVMFRKDVIVKFGMYDPLFLHAEDFELWTRLLPYLRFYNIQEDLVKLRKHSGNISLQAVRTQIRNTYIARLRMARKCSDFKTCEQQLLHDPFFLLLLASYEAVGSEHREVRFFAKIGVRILKVFMLQRIYFKSN